MGGISFDWGVFEKNCRMVGAPPCSWMVRCKVRNQSLESVDQPVESDQPLTYFVPSRPKFSDHKTFAFFFLKVLTKLFVAP